MAMGSGGHRGGEGCGKGWGGRVVGGGAVGGRGRWHCRHYINTHCYTYLKFLLKIFIRTILWGRRGSTNKLYSLFNNILHIEGLTSED